jgi:hypothetical protein
VNEGEAIEAVLAPGYDLRDLTIGDRLVGVKGCEDDSAIDARLCRAAHVLTKRRCRIPRPGQPVALSGVAVTVHNHYRTAIAPLSVGNSQMARWSAHG